MVTSSCSVRHPGESGDRAGSHDPAAVPARLEVVRLLDRINDRGGRTLDGEAPLERLPLYVRAGSILPLGPDQEWATEKPADPIELRIYRGADADFALYEDENDGYSYEKGAYATIPLHWDDAKQTLTIGDRKGQFPGMAASRTFRIVFVGESHGIGVNPEDKPDKTVQYAGKSVAVAP